jgi:hypothetical protein
MMPTPSLQTSGRRLNLNALSIQYPMAVVKKTLLHGLFPMEIHQLRYFAAVAEESSFSHAAKREYVSQPSLSHHLHKPKSINRTTSRT